MMAGILRAWTASGLPTPSGGGGVHSRSRDRDRDRSPSRSGRSGQRRQDRTRRNRPATEPADDETDVTASSLSAPAPRPAATPSVAKYLPGWITPSRNPTSPTLGPAPPPLPAPSLPTTCGSASPLPTTVAGRHDDELFDDHDVRSNFNPVPTGSAPAVGSKIGPSGSGFIMAVSITYLVIVVARVADPGRLCRTLRSCRSS